MTAADGGAELAAHDHASERELWREAVTMVLYVSLVLLAELTVLPARGSGEDFSGISGAQLLAVIWGTTIGLAVAHLFAFRLAVRAFGAGRAGGADLEVALAQLAGAAAVALVASIPVILMPDELEQRSVHVVLAVEIGLVGFLVARIAGQRRWSAAMFGLTALLLGMVVVAVKVALDH
jgi:hypothetical protein